MAIAELVFQSAVLGLCLLAAARLAVKPPVRRELLTAPGLFAGLLLAAGGAGLLWLAVSSPAGRRVLALGAAAVLLYGWWRARPGYGARRRLPPGSLSLGRSLDAIDDRGFYRDQAARCGPVFKMSQFGRPVGCIVGIERAREVLVAQADHVSGATLPYNRFVPRGALRYMSRSEHRDVSPVFRSALLRLDLESAEPAARAAFRAALERMAADSRSRPETGIHPRDYWMPMLLPALARTFLGLDPASPAVDRLGRELAKLDLGRGGGPLWRRRVREGLDGCVDVLREAFPARDAAPDAAPDDGDDGSNGGDGGPAPGSALAHLLAAEPRLFDEPTLTGNLILILRLAYGDLTGLFDWLFKMLTDHPEWLVQLRAKLATDPDAADGLQADRATANVGNGHPPELAQRIVMETLRMEQSEFLYRRIVRPVELEGYVLPAGWLLRVCIQESHRSADVFDEPDRFDPDRFARRAFTRTEYSPFGIDSHACMGARLAVALGSVFVEELARFDWLVLGDGPIERDGNRHRYHWRPNRRLRVRLSPATTPDRKASLLDKGSEQMAEARSRAAASPR